jgi:hypothetical protein
MEEEIGGMERLMPWDVATARVNQIRPHRRSPYWGKIDPVPAETSPVFDFLGLSSIASEPFLSLISFSFSFC